MENEPPEHTRLRRAVSGAFNRGHVERLRPAGAGARPRPARRGRPGSFDVIGAYAEPLPVLVIAELVGLSTADVPSLRRWSQAIVRMYEPSPSPPVVDAAVTAAAGVRRPGARAPRAPARRPGGGPDHRPARGRPQRRRAGRGRRTAAQRRATRRRSTCSATAWSPCCRVACARPTDPALTVEEMLRFDSALQLFERTATTDVSVGGRRGRGGPEDRSAAGSRQPRPCRLRRGRHLRHRRVRRTRTSPSALACTSASAPRSRGWSSSSHSACSSPASPTSPWTRAREPGHVRAPAATSASM